MNPTPEQNEIINHPLNPSEALKIIAYAGTGKTSTLSELAKRFPKEEVLYLAFNKSVEAEAAMKFPFNTTAKTTHALAYQSIGKHYAPIRNLYNWELAKLLHIPIYEASLLCRTLDNYWNSSDLDISEQHIEKDRLERFDPNKYTEGMIEKADLVWKKMIERRDGLAMTHSGYLKLFQLSNPELNYPIVLLDEAQDTNPVVHSIVLQQAQRGSRVYLVGDPYQQIYSWRGAVDAMSKIDCHALRLSQSFRFGPAIASFGSKLLRDFFNEHIPLRGLDSLDSLVAPQGQSLSTPYTIICRTNAGLVAEAYRSCSESKSIHVVGEKSFQEVLEQIHQLYYLYSNQRNLITERRIAFHRSFKALQEYAEETLDVEMMSKLRVVDAYGTATPGVLNMIRKNLTTPTLADVTLTTGHKSKGLEWPNVRIAADFEEVCFFDQDNPDPNAPRWRLRTPVISPSDDWEIAKEEINLLYVACTRAQHKLELTADLHRFLTL